MVEPSCPAFLCHDDDSFRRALIKALDQTHFVVTFASTEEEAVTILRDHPLTFRVALVGVDSQSRRGFAPLHFLRDHRDEVRCGVILLGEPHPALRTLAPWADETLMKPVDPMYVAARARAYCNC